MKPLELFMIAGDLQRAGWKWETWSGSFQEGNAKGWWFIPGAEGVKGMRRGDPKFYDQATIVTHQLYYQESK